MSRYQGQLRASWTEQEYADHVDIIVPAGGLGTRLDAMYEFHAQHGIKPQCGHGKHDTSGADLVGEREKRLGAKDLIRPLFGAGSVGWSINHHENRQ